MAGEKAKSMTDASEVAGIMTPLIEVKLAMEVDPQILREIGMIVGEVVAKMIDNGFTFTAPFLELVVNTVAFNVGKKLMGTAVNGLQDAVSYAALAVNLGVNPGVSFAILPGGSAPALGVAGEPERAGPDLSVADSIDALLKDILAAKKPVEDVATLEFLIEKSVEKGNVEAEIFLLEQLVAKLDGGRGAITRLRRLVELTMGRDKQRAYDYLWQIRAIYSKKGAKNAVKNIASVDAEIASLGDPSQMVVVPVEAPADFSGMVDWRRLSPVPAVAMGDVVSRDNGSGEASVVGPEVEDVSGDVVSRGNGGEAPVVGPEVAEADDFVAKVIANAPADAEAIANAGDGLDEKHSPVIADALRRLKSLELDAVKDMVRVAIAENDGDAVEAFRNKLVKTSGYSDNILPLISANIAVVDILAEAGLYQEAIVHQRRVVDLRRMFRRDLAGKIAAQSLDDKLVELMRSAAQNDERVGPEKAAGSYRSDEGDGQALRRGRYGGASRGRRRREFAHDDGNGNGVPERPHYGSEYTSYLDSMIAAYRAGNRERFQIYASNLLDAHCSSSSVTALRYANMQAAHFFEYVNDFPNALKHWEKVLALQNGDPRNAGNPISQRYIGMTEKNVERVRSLCPQEF